MKFARINDSSKFVVIPNIVEKEEYNGHNKEKRVLILSRMDEIQKQISKSLKIWKHIEIMAGTQEWQLDIVGDGPDLKSLKRYAKRLKLNRVNFYGWEDGERFLKRSSIMLITSSYEGFCMSLLEGKIFKTIPVAYDTFPTVTELIEDGKDGIIVNKDSNESEFAEKIHNLMTDSQLRSDLMSNSNKNIDQYSSVSVGEQWSDLFESLSIHGETTEN